MKNYRISIILLCIAAICLSLGGILKSVGLMNLDKRVTILEEKMAVESGDEETILVESEEIENVD